MPTEHGSLTPVRLLIAESSEHSAERFDSILRDAGIATRVQLIDLPMAEEALPTADVMLCNAELPQLEQLLPQLRIRAPEVPIILVDHRAEAMKTAQGLRLGAADVVSGGDPEELVLVLRRELEHVSRSRRLDRLTNALQEAEERCELLLQTSEAPIAYVHEGLHIHANAPYLKLFGYADAEEVIGLSLMDLLSEDSADALRVAQKRFRQHGDEQHLSFTAQAQDGTPVSGRMTLSAAHYEGEACLQVTVREDAQDEAATAPAETPPASAAEGPSDGHAGPAQSAAAGTATVVANTNETSAVTTPSAGGLFTTAAAFVTDAAQALADPSPCIAVVVAQIDRFAQLQIEHGARNGELISAGIHEALRARLPDCLLGRLATHQFAFVARERDRSSLRKLCTTLLQDLAAMQIPLSHGSVEVQVSLGVALIETENTAPAPEWVESALDLGLAAALRLSEDGGNRFELVGGSIEAENPDSDTGRLLAQINQAIEDNAFRLIFQPIISLRDASSEHYEVYLRMVDGDGNDVGPDDFLSTAIAHGVAGKIDRWVILHAIKALLAQRASGHDTRLTISLTANSITDPDFAGWLGVALKAARLPSDAIIFQVSEADIVSIVRQTQVFLQALRDLHCQSSLARFGVDGNAFERLKHLPVDYVKLDRSLIEGMNAEPQVREQVTQTLGKLQQLGKLSIVPMVETAAMLAVLWQGGANFVQGNYLQPAGPEMDFEFNPVE